MKRQTFSTVNLHDTLQVIDFTQAKRYAKLNINSKVIANEGIIRHLRACTKVGCSPDTSAIREIIDDAIVGKSIYAETDNDEYQKGY